MNIRYIMEVDAKGKGQESIKAAAKPEENDFGWLWLLILTLTILYGLALLFKKYRPIISAALSEAEEGHDVVRNDEPASTPKNPKVIFPEPPAPAKPRVGLKLDDVNDPPPRPASTQKPTTSTTPPPAANPQAKPNVTESSQSSPPAAPGDFEKALALAGQRMDALLRQTEELTRSVKLAEKAKMDAQVELNKATTELTRQLGLKDDQIAKLDAQLDRKSTFPSLRSLIEIKKLCLDMIGTQKPLAHDDLVTWVAGAIDTQLANLEVQVVEFAAGTPLEKIPGDQVETDRRNEPTDDPSKHNQVARLARPCYYIERDSKRIVVAKALVILYRYNAPSSAPEATPSTPTA